MFVGRLSILCWYVWMSWDMKQAVYDSRRYKQFCDANRQWTVHDRNGRLHCVEFVDSLLGKNYSACIYYCTAMNSLRAVVVYNLPFHCLQQIDETREDAHLIEIDNSQARYVVWNLCIGVCVCVSMCVCVHFILFDFSWVNGLPTAAPFEYFFYPEQQIKSLTNIWSRIEIPTW